ncbi:MAG: hypothetical protein K2N00_00535 [Lachnospiraceae bacterium]|nr:hypothetical protein [Lachnospiraceae bacterium]
MKSKNMKRFLAATLAATMMMASALTAAAASGGSEGSSGTKEEVVEATGSEASGSEASAEAAAPVSTTANLQVNGANAKVNVAGTNVQSTVAGAVAVKTVQGVAVTTPAADVKANLGLTGKQTPFIMVFDTDAKKSSQAMACVNAAAEALGGTAVATINVDLSAKDNGKIVALSSGSVGMVVGLPKGADTTKTYSIACVQPGGVVTILKDVDDNPATVTFEVKAGLGTYGIIGK